MNNHRHPPPPPPAALNANTAPEILTHTASIFSSHPITFLFLAFLLFLFHGNVETGTPSLTHFVDYDPSLKAFLSRFNITIWNNPYPADSGTTVRRIHSPPLVHLTRIRTLNDADNNRSPLGFVLDAPPNGSSVSFRNFSPRLEFSNYVAVDNGIMVSKIVQPGSSLKLLDNDNNDDELNKVKNRKFESVESNNNNVDQVNKVKNSHIPEGDDEAERVVDWQSLIKALDTPIFHYLVRSLLIPYGNIIITYLVFYSWVLGTVFVVVVNHLLGKQYPFVAVLGGLISGLRKAFRSVLVRWSARDTFPLLLGLGFFHEVDDRYSAAKIFLRLKLVSFSLAFARIKGFEKETEGFLFAWFMLDTVLQYVFMVDAWVAIADSRRNGGQVIKHGCYLLSKMFTQAVIMKSLELMVCGTKMSAVLARDYGKLFAMAFQSVAEVYFMVASLLFYFALRSKDATARGRTFGLRDLEGFILDRK